MREIVTIEASFSGGKSGLLVKFVDFGCELIEGRTERSRQMVAVGEEGVPLRSQDAQIQLAVKKGDFESVGRRSVAVRVRDAMNEALEAETTQVGGHLRGGIRGAE